MAPETKLETLTAQTQLGSAHSNTREHKHILVCAKHISALHIPRSKTLEEKILVYTTPMQALQKLDVYGYN